MLCHLMQDASGPGMLPSYAQGLGAFARSCLPIRADVDTSQMVPMACIGNVAAHTALKSQAKDGPAHAAFADTASFDACFAPLALLWLQGITWPHMILAVQYEVSVLRQPGSTVVL
jgi:hypothetical protein